MVRNGNSYSARPLLHSLGVLAILVLLMPDAAHGLLSRKPIVDPRTKEGQFFQLLDMEDDDAKRLEMIQQFATMFPKHPAAIWGWEQVLQAQRHAGDHGGVIHTAERLISLEPDHIDAAYYAWKAAGTLGDKAQADKWLQRLNEMSPRIVASARPADSADAANWEACVNLARQFISAKEGRLYSKALEEKDPAKRIAILSQLVKANSETAKPVDIDVLYYLAYRQLGNSGKAVEAGQRVVAVSPTHEDILLFLADSRR